jgi:alpha-beta hydrolase superfamily lysophospholipase
VILPLGAAGIILCESALHVPRRTLHPPPPEVAAARFEDVAITAADGAVLRAWYFPAAGPDTVIVLHGQADNRLGVAGLVPMLLRHDFNVLSPDSRAHGESGGTLTTYGVREVADLSRWLDWLEPRRAGGCVYGLGESMGAAVLIQALARERRFCATAAEAAFTDFREIAYDRVSQIFGCPPWLARSLFRITVDSGLWYGRLRYGVDLEGASPERAAAAAQTPLLLIHGSRDNNVPIRHALRLRQRVAAPVAFWEVPEARHTGAYRSRPAEFEERICRWFTRRPRP